MPIKRIPYTILGVFLTACPLSAGEADAFVPITDPVPAQPAAAADKWDFTFSPYLWAAGLEGTVGIGGTVSEIDLSFSDILENLDIGAMGHFEARKGRWAFLFDGLWLQLESRGSTPGPLFSGSEVDVEEIRLAAQVSYRAIEGPTTLDLLAGASYFSLDTEISLLPGIRPGRKVSSKNEWVDPVIGFILNHRMSERWFATLRGDIGGFGAASDLTWQAMAGIGCQTSSWSSIFLGYRHLVIDYEESDFIYDTETTGFVLGAKLSF